MDIQQVAHSKELKDKIAIVTGAGSGLGRSVALGMARAGATIAIVDIHEIDAVQTCDIIKGEMPHIDTINIVGDVTDEANVEKAVKCVQDKFGKIDILANCAGIAPAGPLIDLSVDAWRRTLEVNLTGYFLMAKHSARFMISQGTGGSIVNLSSKSGLDASKDNTPYNATKAGEIHMARGWAKELG